MNEERRAWKKLHGGGGHRLKLLNDGADDEKNVVALIEQLICPNYYAFQERLVYFQNNLNGLLYQGFVPMDVIHSLFLSRFYDPDGNDGVARFSKPSKCYFYADISAIVAIVYLVVIFTRYNTQNQKFRYRLQGEPADLSGLALRLLNISDYRRKKTHTALLSLMIMRNALFVHDNSEGANEEVNSYPLFQAGLDICYQMGIHIKSESITRFMYRDKLIMKTRSMSPSQLDKLWNYMQMVDSVYSVIMGTPLLINYDFCVGFQRQSNLFFGRKSEQGVMLFRELSQVINSLKAVSMKQVIELIDKVTAYCYELPFKMFEASDVRTGDLDELAVLCKVRMLMIQKVWCLCRMVILAVGDLYRLNSPALEDEATLEYLDSLCKEMYRQTMLSAAMSLYFVKDLYAGASVFGKEPDGKYIVYFRDAISGLSEQSFLIWFSFLFARVTGNPEAITEILNGQLLAGYPSEKDALPYEGEINQFALETAFFHKYTNENTNLGERLVVRLVTSSELIHFAIMFYDSGCQNELIKNNIDSFMAMKALVMWIYALQIVGENKELFDSKQTSLPDILRKASERVEANFNVGQLEGSFEFNPEGFELDKVLDAILVDQNWLEGLEVFGVNGESEY
ncbi:DEKNAAC101801 [Brettanomyces naardenensis]|uniref:DEKNAAC101801 n=1 Tax=Brettanomyces naardenensis TaxID=13370 RepID=A0A448YJB8_BRENA|nr:DEKNAAC101801 [Brettanomyces naardenensis]